MIHKSNLRSCARRALYVTAILGMLPQLNACGSSASKTSASVIVNGVALTLVDQASIGQAATTSHISPHLIPEFNEAIHDYVVNCVGYSSIQLTVGLPSGVLFGWVEASGSASPPTAYSSGHVQHAVSMRPGQRFQFSLSNQAENYSMRCVPADFPQLSVTFNPAIAVPLFEAVQFATPPSAEWYVFAASVAIPPAVAPPTAYVIMADAHGTPVWWMADTGGPFDAKVVGPNEITWTTGAGPLPSSDYVIRNFSGQTVNVIGSELDGHDIQLTPAGTYLTIQHIFRSCPPDCADLSPWRGPAEASVLDEEIAEIDADSNVLWTWKTRDHISLAETGDAGWEPGSGFDIIHMNSVEPDGPDAVIFSARNLSAVYRIIKSTGAIDWKLGGAHTVNSLSVVGDTRPSALGPGGQQLSGQHDARRWPDGTVSVHDNGTIANRPPSVVRYRIDTASRTAEVIQEFSDMRVHQSLCCGSARLLPNGHWVVQWGGAPFTAEFDEHGAPIFTIQYNLGGVFSYRAIPVSPGLVSAATLRAGMDAMAP